MLMEFVELFRATTGYEIVEGAHMEIAPPTIADAVAACVASGASRVVVAPYFLSRGRHILQDIPALVEEARAAHPGVEVSVAEPIGVDPLMAQLIGKRVEGALEGAGVAVGAAGRDGDA
ncbi:unnamed protein product [Pedinophyceae sp. YPF-701]|nr:unnamed protein product [Pedinophyceae sp. YPF-701]